MFGKFKNEKNKEQLSTLGEGEIPTFKINVSKFFYPCITHILKNM